MTGSAVYQLDGNLSPLYFIRAYEFGGYLIDFDYHFQIAMKTVDNKTTVKRFFFHWLVWGKKGLGLFINI
jgi:hypothetical protein